MELNQLRIFIVLSEELNMKKASDRLYITVPAISHQLKTLEEELGFRLFSRHSKGIEISKKGEELIPYAKSVIQQLEILNQYANGLRDVLKGSLRIGINLPSDSLNISKLSSLYQDLHPEISIVYTESVTGDIIEKVKKKDLDLGFVYAVSKSDDIDYQYIKRNELVIAYPKAWEMESKDGKKQMENWNWIVSDLYCPLEDILFQYLNQNAVEIKKTIKTNYDKTKIDLLKSGLAATLIEKELVKNYKEINYIDNEEFQISLYLISKDERKNDPLISTFKSLVNNVL